MIHDTHLSSLFEQDSRKQQKDVVEQEQSRQLRSCAIRNHTGHAPMLLSMCSGTVFILLKLPMRFLPLLWLDRASLSLVDLLRCLLYSAVFLSNLESYTVISVLNLCIKSTTIYYKRIDDWLLTARKPKVEKQLHTRKLYTTNPSCALFVCTKTKVIKR